MELTIESEKVLEAAEKGPIAKQTLKNLFPHAFEEEEVFFEEGDIFTTSHEKVMLAQVEPSWTCLILLTGTARGNRMANPIYVENGISRITKAHLSEMLGYACNVEEVIKTCEKR